MDDMNEVKERLVRIETQLEVHLVQLADKVGKISNLLIGEGDKPGIVVRLDRLEQSETRRAKFLWLAVSAALAALAKPFVL